MQLRLDPKYGAFREEVRTFAQENLPSDIAARSRRGFHGRHEDRRAWTKILSAKGWAGPCWPKECGGPGWDPLQVLIFEEESLLAGAPEVDETGLRLVGAVIYTFGTEEQKRRFLEPTRNADMFWGQGFSEPNAGSDLASLTTRAVRDGDEWVVNGRKIWTTNLQHADYIFCLVKTDPKPSNAASRSSSSMPARRASRSTRSSTSAKAIASTRCSSMMCGRRPTS